MFGPLPTPRTRSPFRVCFRHRARHLAGNPLVDAAAYALADVIAARACPPKSFRPLPCAHWVATHQPCLPSLPAYPPRPVRPSAQEHAPLSALSLTNNALTPSGARALLLALRGSPSLTSLSLAYAGLDSGLENALADALRDHPSLRSLDLSGASFSPDGVAAVAGALRANGELRRLTVQHCALDRVTACLLGAGLAFRSRVAWLDLGNNALGASGAVALCCAVLCCAVHR